MATNIIARRGLAEEDAVGEEAPDKVMVDGEEEPVVMCRLFTLPLRFATHIDLLRLRQ